jgi:hypothetical protein
LFKEGEKGENDGGVNLIKICCKHIHRYHNASPVSILYANKKESKKSTLEEKWTLLSEEDTYLSPGIQ